MQNALSLRRSIEKVQRVGKSHGFFVAIVGGAMVRLVSNSTKIQRIDTKDNVIYLSGAENPGLSREEDKGTLIDIDAIVFSDEKNPFTQKTKANFQRLQHDLQTIQNSDKNFPPVSIEPVFYHPPFPQPNTLTQFVSSVEKDTQGYFFRLDRVKTYVKPQSLAIWTIKFVENPDEEILTLMPIAIQRRYAIRGFSKKPKDIEKVWGKDSSFGKFVQAFNAQTHNTYEQYFGEWDTFGDKIQSENHPITAAKRALWKLYWATIGTYLAHGTGIVGKLLLPLGNTLFAGK